MACGAVLCALLALIIPVGLYLRTRRSRLVQLVDKIPGPRAIPVLGTAYSLINVPRREIFRIRDAEAKKYWPIYRTWNGSYAEIHLSEADDLEVILASSTNIEKSPFYRFFHPWLGKGILTSTGQRWRARRKLVTPTFHFKILESFLKIFSEKSEILVNKLYSELGNTTGFDIHSYVSLCTLDIICETAMGLTINAQENSHSPYVSAVYDDFIFSLSENGKRYKKDLKIIHEFIERVIRERKQLFLKKTEDDVLGQKKKKKVFLDLLLETLEGDDPLTDNDIRDEVNNFMFGGHDTTSTNISWTLFLLGNHPDIQERAYAEIESIFRGSDRQATMSDLSEMKYLERVIKESLRLYPSAPFVGRDIVEEVNVGGYTLPKGCQVRIHIYHAHRNPKYFPNPDEFNPDNFLPERAHGRHPFAYIPFSAGPRNCVGQKFAMLEEKTVLSSILRKYRISAMEKPEEISLLAELVLRPENGIKVKLESRK